MSKIDINILSEAPNKSFDCGNDSINKLVISDAYFSKLTQFAYTWEIKMKGMCLGIV